MPQPTTTIIAGEFDHTQGVYRLNIEIPMNVILEMEHTMRHSTPETMRWIGQLIINQANRMIEEERRVNPLKEFGNERLPG